jgi:hypothetical protein
LSQLARLFAIVRQTTQGQAALIAENEMPEITDEGDVDLMEDDARIVTLGLFDGMQSIINGLLQLGRI